MARIPQNVCRCCEQENGFNQLINISSKQHKPLIDKFLACANVTFDCLDKLPKFFCQKCIKTLRKAYKFKKLCESTHNKFLKLLQPTTDIVDSDVKVEFFEFADTTLPKIIADENNEIVERNLIPKLIAGNDNPVTQMQQITENNIKEDNNILSDNESMCDRSEEINNSGHDNDEDNNKNVLPETKPIKRKSTEHQSTIITYECYLCQGRFKRITNVHRHMQTYHGVQVDKSNDKKRYQCKSCDKTFAFHSAMYRHNKSIHLGIKIKEKKHKTSCDICGREFPSVGNFKRHYESVHLGEKPFVCKICCKRFACTQELRAHQLTHSDKRDYKCEQCPKAFKTQLMLTRHQNIHLPPAQRKRFISKEKAQKYNSQVKICEICGKSLKCAAYYGHIRTHDKIKAFECIICGKRFATKMSLKCHNNTHSGERPYKCDLCEKTYRQSAHLYEHRKLHSGAKPYKCQFCEKLFASVGNYNQHLRVHMGVKAYKCKLCSRSYATIKSLKRHTKHMHTEIMNTVNDEEEKFTNG